MEQNQGDSLGVTAAPSGCQPSASAAEGASSQSGIPNADQVQSDIVAEVRRGINRLRTARYPNPARAIERLLLQAASVAEDAIAMSESLLDFEDLDYDECSREDYELCGARSCEDCGCLVGKLKRAKVLYAQAIEAHRAETVKQGSVEDESAVGNADAPNRQGI